MNVDTNTPFRFEELDLSNVVPFEGSVDDVPDWPQWNAEHRGGSTAPSSEPSLDSGGSKDRATDDEVKPEKGVGKEAIPPLSESDLPSAPEAVEVISALHAAAPPFAGPTVFTLRDPSTIPPRRWLYGNHYIGSFVTLTYAPGGIGKSSLVLAEAIAMTAHMPILGEWPIKPLRVWYWNGEDPNEELERRVTAACKHHGIGREKLGDRLLVDSGREVPIKLVGTTPIGPKTETLLVEQLVEWIKDREIDVVIIDPFVTSHNVSENDTVAINLVVSTWREIADRTGCAVELVHHTSKAGAQNAKEMGVHASRGAGSLVDGVRSARGLIQLSKDEAFNFGFKGDHHSYFQVVKGKANLTVRGKPQLFEMVSVSLGNGSGLWVAGDSVGVCVPRTSIDVFADLSARDLKSFQNRVAAHEAPLLLGSTAKNWFGYEIADMLGDDVGRGIVKVDRTDEQNIARAKVAEIGKAWIKSGGLAIKEVRDTRSARNVMAIFVGEPVTADEAK